MPLERIEQYFDASVDLDPNALAVIDAESAVTYRDLASASRRLAAVFQHMGLCDGQLVAVVGHRDWLTVATFLSVMRCGSAYLPIDANLPSARVEVMISLARPALVVSAAEPRGLWRCAAPIVSLPRSLAAIKTLKRGRTGHNGSRVGAGAPNGVPGDTAYVIFTSGSTGEPKGVMVRHRALVDFLRGSNRELGVGDRARWSCLHSISFDFSAWEMWSPLLSGGTVCAVPRGVSLRPRAMTNTLRCHRVNVLCATPTLLNILMNALSGGLRRHELFLTHVIVGGEYLQVDSIRPLLMLENGPVVVNAYGPTEGTIAATYKIMNIADLGVMYGTESPIGRPFEHVRVRVVDEHLLEVPVDAVGELVIEGPSVAYGYINGDDGNVFGAIQGPGNARCYRTGDLVRRGDGGWLYYVGRADRQQKIRGHRVEMSEVERYLSSVPGVATAAAGLRESADTSSPRALAAFIVRRPGASLDDRAIRSSMRARAPAYMVPAEVYFVRSLPMTMNGKVDLNALWMEVDREHDVDDVDRAAGEDT